MRSMTLLVLALALLASLPAMARGRGQRTKGGKSLAETQSFIAAQARQGHQLSRIDVGPRISFGFPGYPAVKIRLVGAFRGESAREPMTFRVHERQYLRISDALRAGRLRISSRLGRSGRIGVELRDGARVLMRRHSPLRTTLLGFDDYSPGGGGGTVATTRGKHYEAGLVNKPVARGW
jgi:hypothetical protein